MLGLKLNHVSKRWLRSHLYKSVIFEGATLVYRPDCNAEGGCHANSARPKQGRYWLWQPPEALQEGRYISVAPKHNHAIIVITTWSHNVSSFYKFFCFTPVRGVNLIPNTVWSCRRILSRLRADLRENTTKQWGSRDALIQSTGSISDSARYHGDANIALGPILKMYIPGQIHIFNALNSDGYSTGNAPPSGNNSISDEASFRKMSQGLRPMRPDVKAFKLLKLKKHNRGNGLPEEGALFYFCDLTLRRAFQITNGAISANYLRWIPRTKASNAELWYFLWSASE